MPHGGVASRGADGCASAVTESPCAAPKRRGATKAWPRIDRAARLLAGAGVRVGQAGPGETEAVLATPQQRNAAQLAVPAVTVNALGRKCPIPIIMLAERIAEVPVRGLIEVLADDPAAKTDVPAWCALKSHDYLATRDLGQGWGFLVRRSY